MEFIHLAYQKDACYENVRVILLIFTNINLIVSINNENLFFWIVNHKIEIAAIQDANITKENCHANTTETQNIENKGNFLILFCR